MINRTDSKRQARKELMAFHQWRASENVEKGFPRPKVVGRFAPGRSRCARRIDSKIGHKVDNPNSFVEPVRIRIKKPDTWMEKMARMIPFFGGAVRKR